MTTITPMWTGSRPSAANTGYQHRHHDDQDRGGVQEHAEHEQHHVQHQQGTGSCCRRCGRAAAPTAWPTCSRASSQLNREAAAILSMITPACTPVSSRIFRDVRGAQRAVEHHRQHQRVDDRHRTGLGGREHASQDAAEDDHRQHQRRAGDAQRVDDAAQGGALAAGEGAPPRVVDRHHQVDAHQDAGDRTAQEQLPDRDARDGP
nr:hypothetical protein [Ottowia sp.]